MTINQLNALVIVLNSTGEKITDNGTEKLVGRPLDKMKSLLRTGIIEKVKIVSRETIEELKETGDQELLAKDIVIDLTPAEDSLIRECVSDFKGFTPDMSDFVSLYA